MLAPRLCAALPRTRAHAGNTQLFDFMPQSLSALSRKWQASLGFLVGRWGLPVPRQVPLYMVSGQPIPVPRVAPDHPDYNATVDKVGTP
jgi:hypothetical protein